MTEAELLELAAASRNQFAFIVTQIIAIHFAMVAGIYLFLNRAGILLKLAVLILYSAGYAGLLGIYFWEQWAYNGIAQSLAALPDTSAATAAVLGWSAGPGRLQATSSIALLASGWIIVFYALFGPSRRDQV